MNKVFIYLIGFVVGVIAGLPVAYGLCILFHVIFK
jgi:hypothetical protein